MRVIFLLFSIAFLYNCAGFSPLYQSRDIFNEKLRNIAITTDKNRMSLSIKKYLLKKMPPASQTINYIIRIETKTETASSATSTDRKTSGYEVIATSDVSLYKRELKYDRKIYSFEEKEFTMFELSPNQVLSTLASRNKAFEISSENLSKRILNRIMLYFTKENNVNK